MKRKQNKIHNCEEKTLEMRCESDLHKFYINSNNDDGI